MDLEGNSRPAESGYDMGAYEVTPDSAGPTGTIVINAGDDCTSTTLVELALSADDPSGVSEMQFSNDNASWSVAETYATSKAWELAETDGAKSVYVKYKDNPRKLVRSL